MNRLITPDDFTDVFQKLRQRGISFLLSKLSFNSLERTRSSFDEVAFQHANYWIIPGIKKRWNRIISGDENLLYEDYTAHKYFGGKTGMRMLSLGSGICSHEMQFASHTAFEEVTCIDISAGLLKEAERTAHERGLTNMRFLVTDINKLELESPYFDAVLFHSALHHFENVEALLIKLKQALKPGGFIILNDYTGPARLQWTAQQVEAVNHLLDQIPASHKQRFMRKALKNKVYGPGLLRMRIADPSEAVESDRILPALHKHFEVIEEKKLGGNIIMPLFKDIAHHFTGDDAVTQKLLAMIFEAEDKFLANNPSDLVFGVYSKK